MKKMRLLPYILLVVSSTYGQTPDAFKYQAVIRGSDGSPIVDKQITIRASIISGSPGNTAVYTELHTATTNASGLTSLEIGHGDPVLGNFNSIDWAAGKYFLALEMDLQGTGAFESIGTSTLLSVPYALYAGKADARATFEVNDVDGLDPDSALFVVKNRDGLPVFAVYQDGVRVYVDNKPVKGGKGGFAIGGRSTAKGPVQDLMWVTSDSVRIYLDDHPAGKGGKGGFAVGGRTTGKGEVESFTLLTPDNYLIGQGAGKSITTGTHNAFLGYRAGQNTTAGLQNVFLGYYSGFQNDTGSSNIFIGDSSGFFNTGGYYNVFIGPNAGFSNTVGFQNIALGTSAGTSLQSGNRNIMVGVLAGNKLTDGINNVFVGNAAGMSTTTGNFNVLLGRNAGLYSTTGESNVMVGHRAGFSNTTGSNNIFIGQYSGFMSDTNNANIFIGNTSGYYNHGGEGNTFLGNGTGYKSNASYNNTFLGLRSGFSTATGSENTFAGAYAGFYTMSGYGNTFIGNYSGQYDTLGSYNVYIGLSTGEHATGSNNVFIGQGAGRYETASNRLYISNSESDKNNALIYGEFDSHRLVINGYLGLGVVAPSYRLELPNSANANGQARANAWLTYSDRRLKDHIQSISYAMNKIEQLDGVTFDWKETHKASSGFIAQDVEKILPELVETGSDGIKAVDYSRLTPYLVNALKEQQKVISNQQEEIDSLRKDLEGMRTILQNAGLSH